MAAMLGTSGPTMVPATIRLAACAPNVLGNVRTTASAMRLSRPDPFIPAPRPNAANNSHHVADVNAERATEDSTPPMTANSTTMTIAVAYVGNTLPTHHTTARMRMARHLMP